MKTKERILQEALRQFNERGISQVGVRDIARSLDMSAGNLSYHFSRKADIIIELLTRFRKSNDLIYERYFEIGPSLSGFLDCLREVFNNQYEHAGLMVGQGEVQEIIRQHFNYKDAEHNRKDFFRRIFTGLRDSGELTLSAADIDFLISFISLFGRFWMIEAAVSFADWPREKIIDYYIGLIERQLSLFKV
ncbi:MAG: TetR/AcrR family transcriptional regulator [Saprospiraceae bacterium]|nr:TetR/AcrR family transcriptional regulator [Saprospiraceae bacterium]